MKLFLSSSTEALPLLSTKLPKGGKGAKVLFIANAADNIAGDHWWVEADREALVKLGCKINEIDLRKVSKDDFIKTINSSDLIHFCGGSTLYLISAIKKSGLHTIISDAVKQGKIMYSGTSAGSMIVVDDMKLKLCKYDEEDKELVNTMTDYSGLGLVNFLIIPHCNNKDFVESTQNMIIHLPENPMPLILINDSQAVWVEDEKFEIVSVEVK